MLNWLTCCYPSRRPAQEVSEPPEVESLSADTRSATPAPPSIPRLDTALRSYAVSKKLLSRQISMSASELSRAISEDRQSKLDEMTWGMEAVADHELQGLPKENLEEILSATNKRGYMFSHRPVAPLARRPIAEGNPTKPFAIKGKSADAGFQQSFICIDQNYSKLGGVASPEELAKSNKEVASISASHAIAQPLKISTERMQELINLPDGGIVQTGEVKDKKTGTHMLTYQITPKNGEPYEQVLSYNKEDGYWYVNIVVDGHMEPLEVLCHPESLMPITADVDPLIEAYPWQVVDLAHEDRLPVPMISFKETSERLKTYQRIEQRKQNLVVEPDEKELTRRRKVSHSLEALQEGVKLKHFLENEDPVVGNVSQRVKGMIDHFGKSEVTAIDRDEPLVHHNTDSTSPFSKEKDNYPATMYFPDYLVARIPEITAPIVMVHTSEQLQVIIQLLKDHGMFMYITPDWKELAAVRSHRFIKNRSLLEEQITRLHAQRIKRR